MRAFLIPLAVLLLSACEVLPEPSQPLQAPVLSSTTLSGTVPAAIAAEAVVLVDGTTATLDGDAWSATVDLAPRQTTVEVELQIDGYTVARQTLELSVE